MKSKPDTSEELAAELYQQAGKTADLNAALQLQAWAMLLTIVQDIDIQLEMIGYDVDALRGQQEEIEPAEDKPDHTADAGYFTQNEPTYTDNHDRLRRLNATYGSYPATSAANQFRTSQPTYFETEHPTEEDR